MNLEFSAAEWQRRRELLGAIADAHGLTHVLLYGAERSGSAVPWLTGWPVTREALVVWTADEADLLLVQFRNHVPLATRVAGAAVVRWGGPSTIAAAVEELRRRRAPGRVGVIGALPFTACRELAAAGLEAVDLGAAYVAARLVKSSEELSFLRRGAQFSDAGLHGLVAAARPGVSEHELADAIERAYVPSGGQTHIHYLLSTPMARPEIGVPAQLSSGRRLEPGDVVVTEISASYRGYAGQVLRTITVGSEPTALYADLHDVAQAAFDRICSVLRDGTTAAEVIEAAAVIEDSGFTICDDLLHGYGGGYLPPVLGSRSRPHHRGAEVGFRAGMTVVVQPNVVTLDGTAGVQTGELVHVTSAGVERLHSASSGLITADGA
ncbi:MAG TPA: M24 family metallopeptidase [Jiangellales bacterium]|nr:M24 family metallopeptidase [Jiangellales bacterium]